MKKLSVVITACLLLLCVFACVGCGDYEKDYVTVKFIYVEDNSSITVIVKVGDKVNVPVDLVDVPLYTDVACTEAFDIETVMENGGSILNLYYAMDSIA